MRAPLALTILSVCALPLVAADGVDYMRDVKPLFARHCYACHGAEKQRSGLRLDTAKAAFLGGNSGAVVVKGKSDTSRLIQALLGSNDVPPMPPKGPRLSEKEIALVKRWIDEGANAPANESGQQIVKATKHWSFQPLTRPSVPEIHKPQSSIRNPIDNFILATLAKHQLTLSPEADRATLLRRVSLDLTGLPPTLQEVDAFLNDRSPNAYEKVVDRLLASPHHGERWGRHWLDAARYADSNGFTIDGSRVIWPYRDWVIKALNRDMPFDQFTIEQLAGDLLPRPTREQLVATGFHRNTLFNQEGGIDQEQFRTDYVIDRVSTTGSVFLGLTVGCAQCHDHKFDPLSQREFYQFFAFFNSCDEPTLELPTPEQERLKKDLQARITELDKQRKVLDTTSAAGQTAWEMNLSVQAHDKLPAEIQRILDLAPNSRDRKQQEAVREIYRQSDMSRHVAGALDFGLPFMRAAQVEAYLFRNTVDQRIADLKKTIPDIPTTLILRERKTPRTTHVLLGGDFTRKGAAVKEGTPAVLPPLPETKEINRLALARWIVDPKNPLTARVIVNRFWQQYFGVGLVETENDFGTQGTPPSHPELLDWLASEFIARRWSMKELHRLIVTSAAYRQSSKARPELATIDPRNRLLSRQNRLRLDAEVVRDTALSVSGMLSHRIGGPSVYPPQPEGVYAFTQLNKDWKPSTGADRYRRGLYTYFWRSAPHPGLMAFDAPDGNTTCTRRIRSNTPLQALTLLNDKAYFELAQYLAKRCLIECSDEGKRLDYLFRVSLGRDPAERERRALARLLARQRQSLENATQGEIEAIVGKEKQTNPQQSAVWTMAARVLLNLDEFITRE
jgi:mono/diheme cytochrome c family protein